MPADERATLRWLRIQLSMLDPTMLTSPDGKRVEINLSAIEAAIRASITTDEGETR